MPADQLTERLRVAVDVGAQQIGVAQRGRRRVGGVVTRLT
jgi:RNase H-fold protein (predicted Holliday junction resolvase)